MHKTKSIVKRYLQNETPSQDTTLFWGGKGRQRHYKSITESHYHRLPPLLEVKAEITTGKPKQMQSFDKISKESTI